MEDNKDVDMPLSSDPSSHGPRLVYAPRVATDVVVAAHAGSPFGTVTTFSRPEEANGTSGRAGASAPPVAMTSGAAQHGLFESGANAANAANAEAEAAQSPPTTITGHGETTRTSRAQAQTDARQRRRSEQRRAALQQERNAQQAMIDAQRDTIRAGDQVIEALRHQVSNLESRLQATSQMNRTLLNQQHELLSVAVQEQQRLRDVGTASGISTTAAAAAAAGAAPAARTGVTPIEGPFRPSTIHVSPGSVSGPPQDEAARLARREQIVREAMSARRRIVEQTAQTTYNATARLLSNNDEAGGAPSPLSSPSSLRRRRIVADPSHTTSAEDSDGMDAPRQPYADSTDDEDIYSDMPHLEGLDGQPVPPSPELSVQRAAAAYFRPLEEGEAARAREDIRQEQQSSGGSALASQSQSANAAAPGSTAAAALDHADAPAIRAQNRQRIFDAVQSAGPGNPSLALERLRADPTFRTRIRQYMHPDTARRILEVLDRPDRRGAAPVASGGTGRAMATVPGAAPNTTSSATAEPPNALSVPGAPGSEERYQWELKMAIVDRNGMDLTGLSPREKEHKQTESASTSIRHHILKRVEAGR